ncbi:KTSC domain-containing protein [Klebsiella aerogenes]|uniref:KTSC domain-containing protein n=1 Tax=Enterobacteriaceae TaxID=543 RepID=UPI0009080731|nr:MULTISPECIES: KTSC domain-containing protein [Enterobacteriaceae]UAS93541.1 KTSC domain-containing protein [Enterobacter cloacae complex sp.]MCW3146583.1 KTSC domain-containing protein [Enterobacter hormaechei]HBZ4245148.1 KTSC domain-containing protein [Klebsiella aerogenes]HCB3603578.1 KTSC domain-containing protein [Klebsiella aerogenes]HCD3923819.1 KTSC domain-containing protein [Klebsiella aerogenes]
MERKAVNSSNLASVGYDEPSQTLEIEFHHGGVYQYYDVPEHVYMELTNADSIGSYFSHNIRNDYPTQKI